MKKSFLLGIALCLAMVAGAQRSMEWYSYWGSNVAGSQIEPKRMVVDNAGNIYVAALYGGNKVSVESQTLSSMSPSDKGDAVIVKMTPTKQIEWTYSLAAVGNATISDVVVDKEGNIVATGAFTNTLKVGNTTMKLDDTNLGEVAIYVLKLKADGQAIKAWQIPALGAKGGKLAIDAQNNIIVTGLLDGDATFEGNIEGDFQNSAQMFVAKYDANGNHIWHQFRNDANSSSSYGLPSVDVDAQGNIYVAGTLSGTTTFAGTTVTAAAANAFILAYDAAGTEKWYHMIDGDQSDEATAVAVSPIGQVALALNHHSGNLYIDDMAEEFNNGYAFDPQYAHAAVFAFDLNGEFKWFFDWGYSNGTSGSDAICNSLRCTDEGVWYMAGMMTGRYGGSRLPEEIRTLPAGKNSGVESVDNQWIQHNTNGGHDTYLLTLTRSGMLANVVRPGGPQYEIGTDMALSPDKKSIYFLSQINVRDNVPYTCPDNIFDSWTDLYAPTGWASRKSNYTILNVFCPENDGSSTNYSKTYKANFASSMLVKYTLPEINPNKLPFFTVNEAYAQTVAIANAIGVKQEIVPMEKTADVGFDGVAVTGTFEDDKDRFVGLLAIDSTALPGDITYYEYDKLNNTYYSIRSNPRTLRYMPLTIANGTEGIGNVSTLEATVYPTLCEDNLYIKCDESQYTVNIYTADGRMIFSNDNVAGIAVGNNLAAGNYLVEVTAKGKRTITPIIVK